ncbi:type IV conjugative transfer system protein TraE [Burkholderia stagnalis]|uniref:type IV conjugative transfer system protein TraE n=1 Tax=Burkholderia stagnalis TaxID=1503054 RepID=UPI00075FF8D7|nr:type IV conjugative transfer system protein TraE [Burkholderia stagnalis]KWN65939.1 conjugal transfer protein TraE [Burkholderia stagnalis]
MRPDIAKNERDKLSETIRFHRKVISGQAVANVLLTLLVGWTVLHDTTRIVPPEVKRPYQIGAGQADKDYLSDMSGYVLGLILTSTPETVDYNNSILLKMAEPEQYPVFKTQLDAAAIRIKREKITTIWSPQSAQIFVDAKRVIWKGTLKTYIADQPISTLPHTYVVELPISFSGRTYVRKAEEVLDSTRAAAGRSQ